MIKNIIFDIGGVIFDDSKSHIDKLLNKDSSDIYRKAYNHNFKRCMTGDIDVDNHIKTFENDPDYEEIKYILCKDNLKVSYPIMKENYEYIKTLKDKYNLYLLTNITKDSYNYIMNTIDTTIFKGGIYSHKVHLIKPDTKIYELILDKYNLEKSETIFFDDRECNVDAANSIGLKSVVFKSIDDIKNNI